MNRIIRLAALGIVLVFCLGGAPAALAEGPAPATSVYDEDEAKEQQAFLRPFLEPSFLPSPEYIESCKGIKGYYTGDETPEKLKAQSAQHQAVYDKIVSALPAKLSVPVERKRKILVLTYRTGGLFHGEGAAGLLILLREAARKYGAFELTEAYKPDGVDEKMLAGFDAVVLNGISFKYRSGKYGVVWGKDADTNLNMERMKEADKVVNPLYDQLLPDYLKNGGGLFATHGAALINMGQGDKPGEFTAMLGGVVDDLCHPKKPDGSYFKGEFSVKLLEPENPLVAAFRDAPQPIKLTTELYSFWLPASSAKDTRPILGFDHDKMPEIRYLDRSVERSKEFASAMIWIRDYGKGRVYYNVMGHDEEIHMAPCVAQSILDGLLYATDDLKVPTRPTRIPPASQ